MLYLNKFILFSIYHNINKLQFETFDPVKYNYNIYHSHVSFLMNNTKLKYFNTFLKNNTLLDRETYEILSNNYYKCVKTEYALSRFVTHVVSKIRPIHNNTTLLLDDTSSLKHKFEIHELNKKYVFGLNDLYNIINNTLTSTEEGCLSFNKIKNPYTNNVLTNETMYRIYLFLFYNYFKIPKIFNKLMDCDFDYDMFYENNKKELLFLGLKNEYINLSPRTKRYYMIKMITKHGNIDYKNVNYKLLCEIFEPFLEYYYLYNNYTYLHLQSFDSLRSQFVPYYFKYVYRKYLKMKGFFRAFKLKNPLFGRKIKQKNSFESNNYKEYIYETVIS